MAFPFSLLFNTDLDIFKPVKIFWLPLIAIVPLFISCGEEKQKSLQTWETYRGSKAATQFSSLDQINTSNVDQLEPAWAFQTGDATESSTIECNPIVVNGIMYITSPRLKLIALDPATGKELWRFDPANGGNISGVNRGVTYWTNGKRETIFLPAGHFLYALDAKTGVLDKDFGSEGKIDMRKNLGKDPEDLSISLSTPGIVYKNTLIIGSATGEGYDASPGHIRAYNAATGEFKWIFHTIPQKGQLGYDTWEWVEGENYGGANNWGGMSLDQERGLVFVPTGSPVYDFYGANRRGKNLFANSLIALDVETGERKWHYQAVYHDLWDYDLPCAPTLATIPWEGENKDVLLQPTKMGELIILDRETGENLLNPEEKSVPASDVPGEAAYPTQKLNQGIQVVKKQGFDTNYITNISPEARQYVKKELQQYRMEGEYTPPSVNGSINMPGTRGGMGWSGMSYDPENNMAYMNVNEFPMIFEVKKIQTGGQDIAMNKEGASVSGRVTYLSNCSNCHGADREGVNQAFPSLIGLKDRYEKEEVKEIIRNGKGQMPAFPQYKGEELNKLLKFLMEESTTTGSIESEELGNGFPRYSLQGFRILRDQNGFPASKPPWGTLNAVDMKTMEIKWKVPLGTYPELAGKDISPTGTQSFGGCVATAGDLVFIGGAADEKFRAFDANTGEVLWSYQLPAGGYATPAVYQVDGKQYVVIAAGGGNRNGTPSGDTYFAFSLPSEN